jgi:membrane protease YdiL (CAAX protease family)
VESRTKGIVVFIAIAFGMAWAGMFAAPLLFGLSLVNPLVQLAGIAFTPAIAAFIVRKWVTREGFADAGMRPRIREHWRLYLAAWLGPLAFAAVSLAVAVAVGLWDFDPASLALIPGAPVWATIAALLVVVVVLTPIYWGEEFGWTSYLRLRLLPERPLLSTLATGLIWAIWHYPLAFMGYIEFDNVVLGLAVWTVSFMLQEVILTWLRLRSGSVWTASLAHAGNNMVFALLIGTALGDDHQIAGTLLGIVPCAVIALWLMLSGRVAADRHTAAPLEREPVAAR